MQMIFDGARVKEFKQAYNRAVETQSDWFWFQDNKFMTSFAKYVIEYFEIKGV